METFLNVLVVTLDKKVAIKNGTAKIQDGGAKITVMGSLSTGVSLQLGGLFHISSGEGVLDSYGRYVEPFTESGSSSPSGYIFINDQ